MLVAFPWLVGVPGAVGWNRSRVFALQLEVSVPSGMTQAQAQPTDCAQDLAMAVHSWRGRAT